MGLNKVKIKNATSLKYVNTLGTSDPCIIEVVYDSVKYGVPIDTGNAHYEWIQELLDDGEITKDEADA